MWFTSNTQIRLMTNKYKKERVLLEKELHIRFGSVSFLVRDQIQCQINILLDCNLAFELGSKELWSLELCKAVTSPHLRASSHFPGCGTGSHRSWQALKVWTFHQAAVMVPQLSPAQPNCVKKLAQLLLAPLLAPLLSYKLLEKINSQIRTAAHVQEI